MMRGKRSWAVVLAALVVCMPMGMALASQTKQAEDIERIGPEAAYQKVKAGEALLVCAYGDEKCKGLLLEGALLRSELESRRPALPKDQEIIFYCG